MRASETERSSDKIRLAVLGHLPAAADCARVEIAALVDTNLIRARPSAAQAG